MTFPAGHHSDCAIVENTHAVPPITAGFEAGDRAAACASPSPGGRRPAAPTSSARSGAGRESPGRGTYHAGRLQGFSRQAGEAEGAEVAGEDPARVAAGLAGVDGRADLHADLAMGKRLLD